jgi:hypothetical protein
MDADQPSTLFLVLHINIKLHEIVAEGTIEIFLLSLSVEKDTLALR